MAASFPLSFFLKPLHSGENKKTATMSAPVPNLQSLLQHQHSTSSYINNKPIIVPLSAAAAAAAPPNPNPISPNTTTITFSVLKPKLPRKKPDPISLAKRATATGIIPPCTECGKRFSLWKALFGHMRCHPERQWRGINPPAQFRHRGGGGPLAHFTSEEYKVASSLILLANGPSPRDEGGPSAGLKRRWEEAQATVAALGCEHLNSSSSSSHKCSICLREFSTGQALGGHMRCRWDTKVEVEDNSFAAAAASSSRDLVLLDLNLPPPGAGDINSNNETAAVVDASVLDLRLGMRCDKHTT